MKRLYLLIFFISSSLLKTNAQGLIAVERGISQLFFSSIDSAFNNLMDGDMVYLPGGSFTPSGGVLKIKKNVNIIGAGYFADSSLATSQTIINNRTVGILNFASGGSLQGVYIMGSLFFGNNNTDNGAIGFSISRCFISGDCSFSFNGSNLNPSV